MFLLFFEMQRVLEMKDNLIPSFIFFLLYLAWVTKVNVKVAFYRTTMEEPASSGLGSSLFDDFHAAGLCNGFEPDFRRLGRHLNHQEHGVEFI
jgi:hypothetical protein